MSGESVEVRVARLEENLRFLVEEAREAKASRKSQYETNELVSRFMTNLSNDVQLVRDKLAGQTPTIEEFITIKHKVEGAGKAGTLFWSIGSALLGALASAVMVFKYFTGH